MIHSGSRSCICRPELSDSRHVKTPHLLNLGNARRVKENLSKILDKPALDAIENEIARNAAALYRLGLHHLQFARRQPGAHWRQRISRLYYGAYNISRAVRLFVTGAYASDVKDHQKFDELPDDFPSRERFANQLAVLREDRNTCDYDHASRARDLVLGTRASTLLVKEFASRARDYFKSKGLTI